MAITVKHKTKTVMKKLFFLATIIFSSANILAQKSLSIQVLDSLTNEPIAGATLSINQKTFVTSNDGYAFFYQKDGLNSTCFVRSFGYVSKEIDLLKSPQTTVKLLQINSLMMPIEIKAVRAGLDYPFTQTFISRRTLESKNVGQDIPVLLNQVPGTVINADAGNGIGYTGIRIRGTDATRINVTLNGIPYNDAESQGVFFVNLPDLISSTNSIQVQRGVGTSSNGTGAFGATINLLTNEVKPVSYATLSNSIGSFNTWKNTIKAGTGLINNRYIVDMRLSSISSDGYVERAKSNLKSFYVSAASIKEKSSLRMNIFSGKEKTYQSWYGVTEDQLATNRRYNSAGTEKTDAPYDNETDNYTQTHFQLFYNKKINKNWSINNASYLTKGEGYYEQYKLAQSFDQYGLKNPVVNGSIVNTTDLIRQLWLDNTLIGNNVSLQFKDDKKEIIAGAGMSNYQGNHQGKVIWANTSIPKNHSWYNHDSKKSEQFAFVKWLQQVRGNLFLFGDVQVRNVGYKIDGFRNNPTININQKWTFINPKFGLKKKINGYEFYASYALANKEPNRDDFESGVAQIPQNETLHDFETGIEKISEKMKLSVTGYYMRYINQLVLNGKINDVGAYTRTNIANSYRTGIEIEANFQLADWLKVDNNVALSSNKIMNYTDFYDDYDTYTQKSTSYKKSDLAYSPNLVVGSTISARIIRNLETKIISKYVGLQYLDNTSRKDRSLDPFFVQDLQLNYQFKMKDVKTIEMILQINNFWNRLYAPNGYTYSYIYNGEVSRNNYYYPMAGLNFMFGLNLNF